MAAFLPLRSLRRIPPFPRKQQKRSFISFQFFTEVCRSETADKGLLAWLLLTSLFGISTYAYRLHNELEQANDLNRKLLDLQREGAAGAQEPDDEERTTTRTTRKEEEDDNDNKEKQLEKHGGKQGKNEESDTCEIEGFYD